MRKKTIFILLLLFLATFGFSACTALYEDRDKIVEDEMDKYNVQIAAYDRLEKNFDYTDSVRAVESRNGHNRGTRFSSNDDPDNTLFHLNDLDESTVYQSSAYADAAQKVIVTADMQKSKFIDRIQISPAKDKDGGTTGFPKSFYIELSNDMSNWTIVAARSDYPVPAETAVFRIAAQSARYHGNPWALFFGRGGACRAVRRVRATGPQKSFVGALRKIQDAVRYAAVLPERRARRAEFRS